ncbi:MAG: hypothetical protein ACRDRH_01015 [Pseudonocardia sp.]
MKRRHKPDHTSTPAHVVLDNEALAQISTGRPSRPLVVDLQVASDSGGLVVLPTSVLVERNHDRTAPAAAPASANRILRDARFDALTAARAAEAVALRARSGEGGSVVDAHIAAAALAVVQRFGGTATVATSDPTDISRLLDGAGGGAVRAVTGVLAL